MNSQPTFVASLVDQNIVQGHSLSYTLPATNDVDLDTVSITTTYPAFVTYTGSTYSINPTISYQGSYPVSITLSDGITSSVSFSFNIIVALNTPPTFSSIPLAN